MFLFFHCNFNDSRSLLEFFDSLQPFVIEIFEWIFLIRCRNPIVNFCCVPTQISIQGNEMVYKLAKEEVLSMLPTE